MRNTHYLFVLLIIGIFLLSMISGIWAANGMSPHDDRKTVDDIIDEVASWYKEEFCSEYENTRIFMREIANIESNMGTDKTTYSPGYGLGFAQFDKGPAAFRQVQKNVLPKKMERVEKIKERWGFNPLTISIEALDRPGGDLISAIFLREFILSWPEKTPNTLGGRANLWKKKYNTVAGDGTPEKYIGRNSEILIGGCKYGPDGKSTDCIDCSKKTDLAKLGKSCADLMLEFQNPRVYSCDELCSVKPDPVVDFFMCEGSRNCAFYPNPPPPQPPNKCIPGSCGCTDTELICNDGIDY